MKLVSIKRSCDLIYLLFDRTATQKFTRIGTSRYRTPFSAAGICRVNYLA